MPIPLNVIAPKAQRLIWSTVSGSMSLSLTCYSTINQKSHISILISSLPPFYTIPPSVPPFSFSSNNVLLIARLTKIVFLFSLFPFFFLHILAHYTQYSWYPFTPLSTYYSLSQAPNCRCLILFITVV